MKRADLPAAAPGHYVVDLDNDDVLSRRFATQPEALEAAASWSRRGKLVDVVEVVDVIVRIAELCMSNGCKDEVHTVCAPSGRLKLHDVVIQPGTELRLCAVHHRELRDVARLQLVELHDVGRGVMS